MAWEEMAGAKLPSDAILQAWRQPGSLAQLVRQGHKAVLSYGYYLDALGQTVEALYRRPLEASALNLEPQDESRFLGVEVCVWSELVKELNFDTTLWPRTAAVAERLWLDPGASLSSPEALQARLELQERRFKAWGLTTSVAAERLEAWTGPQGLGSAPLTPQGLEAWHTLTATLESWRQAWWPAWRQISAFEPDSLADVLPPESPVGRDLVRAVQRLQATQHPQQQQQSPQHLEAAEQLRALLLPLLPLAEALKPVVAVEPPAFGQALQSWAEQTVDLAKLGLTALAHHQAGQALSLEQRHVAEAVLKKAGQRFDSGVRSGLVRGVQSLVQEAQAVRRRATPQ